MARSLLFGLDVGPPGALLRAALGGAFVVLLRVAYPDARLPLAAAVLALLLFGVKAAAAVARRLIAAPPDVRVLMEWRRNLARFHDSYQWRKLAWIGVGILAARLLPGEHAGWEAPLGTACLAGGLAAALVWRRKRLPLVPPLRAVREAP